MHHTVCTLTPTPPFDFAHTLRFLAGFAPGEGEQQLTGDTLTRAVRVAGQTVVCRVASTGSVDAPELACDLFAADALDEATVAEARERVGFWLSIGDDLRPFYTTAEGDVAFAPIAREWRGYHQVKFLTPFENACGAVLSQRTPMAAARAMKERLVARYGDALAVDGETFAAFPAPEDFAGTSPDDLLDTIRNSRKADYLGATIEAWRTVDEGWLRTAPYDEVERWLRGIRGVGAWSASFVLVRGLGRMERIAPDDALVRAAARVYGQPLTPGEFAGIAARYGNLRGYWGHYLRVAS